MKENNIPEGIDLDKIENKEPCSAVKIDFDSSTPIHKQSYRSDLSEHHPYKESFFSPDTYRERMFILQGLDCPHCSVEIEKKVGNLDGVSAAAINLVKQILTVEYSESYKGDLFNDVSKIVTSLEPDVIVIDKASEKKEASFEEHHNHNHNHDNDNTMIIRLVIGGLIFAAGLAAEHLTVLGVPAVLPIIIVSYLILGYDVVLKAFKNILKGRVFDENFLMTISTIGAFIIGEYPEAAAVMLFYQIGEYLQGLAVKNSRRSISELMDIRPDSANVKRDGRLISAAPEEVNIGELIMVKPGEKIPLDGIVTEGESLVNTVALTGESVPRSVKQGDEVLSGFINENGVLTIKVTKPFKESTVSKILNLVENAASKKAPSENFITTFSHYYTPIVVILALVIGIVPPLMFGGVWSEWLNRCFVFLVISCPCALVISIPLTFFGGIGSASKNGILVKGSNYLELLTKIDTIVFDKTGTLTEGVFRVTEVVPSNVYTEKSLLEIAAKAECLSNHPIALSIVKKHGKRINKRAVKNYSEVSGHGVSAEIDGHIVLAGNEKLMKSNNISLAKNETAGTVIYIAVDSVFAGSIVISDKIKDDSKQAISDLKKLGITKTVMLTGDNEKTAKAVASELDLSEYHSELLPDQKVGEIEILAQSEENGKKLAFVGDGINDAPVLARADIGIAMGALGSDAAIEAADVVLMTDEPSKIAEAVLIARYTKKIVTQNIVFVIAVKILFLILGAFGIAGMWQAVFADVGVMILAVLNSMRILLLSQGQK